MTGDAKKEDRGSLKEVSKPKSNFGHTFNIAVFNIAILLMFIAIFAFLPYWILMGLSFPMSIFADKKMLKLSRDRNYKSRRRYLLKFSLAGLFVSIVFAIVWIFFLGWVSFVLFEVVCFIALYLVVTHQQKKREHDRHIQGSLSLGSAAKSGTGQSGEKHGAKPKKRRRSKPGLDWTSLSFKKYKGLS